MEVCHFIESPFPPVSNAEVAMAFADLEKQIKKDLLEQFALQFKDADCLFLVEHIRACAKYARFRIILDGVPPEHEQAVKDFFAAFGQHVLEELGWVHPHPLPPLT